MVKSILTALVTGFLMLATGLSAAEEDKQAQEIKELTTAFWNKMTAKEFPEAKKSLFVKEDHPEIASPDQMAKRVAEEFDKMTLLVKNAPTEKSDGHKFGDVQEIKAEVTGEERGQLVASVILMVWEPKEKEFEKVSITWIKTPKSGWKIVDL